MDACMHVWMCVAVAVYVAVRGQVLGSALSTFTVRDWDLFSPSDDSD